ncbi:MAG: aldehyde dehydrogenase family protein [Thermoguttaceae bacterium]|jgi:acetaldehyde dehydrogenase/alcohol dehydrogenase|nr:aldehyde dehydrogenase family protein [Thermoguttaceae bacterium]
MEAEGRQGEHRVGNNGNGQTPNVDEYFQRANAAAAVFSQFDQEQTDRVVWAVYQAAFNQRVRLAKLAYEETGMGKWQDKVLKNALASQFVYEDIKDLKTVGVISDDPVTGVVEIAQPMGPILAIIPVTNPTSTAIFKIMIALKTRNPIIISPSRKAKCSTDETARICYEAAMAADAPEHCIQWLPECSRELTQAIMSHKSLALILATGGTGLVKSAYSSGTPTIGVGAGNVPVYIERSADVPFAVEQIMISKLFDNGTICASEQALVVEEPIAAAVIDEFQKRNGYFLTDAEVARLEPVAVDAATGMMNSAVVGKPAAEIARMAGIDVPAGVELLIAPLGGVGDAWPLSSEVLAPVLAWYVARDFDAAVKLCIDLNYHGGMGHTASIFSNDDARVREFAGLMNAGRIVVNTPSSQGAVGGTYNMLHPSFTLGCGTGGRNITSDNVTANHLLNIQRIARRRENQRFARFNPGLYFDESLEPAAILAAYNKNY